MTPHYYRRSTCRLCSASDLQLVVPITPTPIADAYVPVDRLGEVQDCYPLDLYQCCNCGHVQLLDVVAPELLFSEYSYFSGRAGGMGKHFDHYADQVVRKTGLPQGAFVVDIGSNDGAFLRCFQQRGMRVLGVDPAENIARAANEAGIETLPEFFHPSLASVIATSYGKAQVVAANNVFAHTDELAGMADAVRGLLADDGVFVFEVSYLLDVVDHLLLGTIFHEHLCYHSVQPLDAFLRRHGLELIDVERVPIQGGSLIGTAQHIRGPRRIEPSVAALKALEDERELHHPATLRAFSSRIEQARDSAAVLLQRLQAEGHTIAGFGAARAGTLLIYHFGLGTVLEFIVDDSPDKQNLYSPGYHIPVFPSSVMYQRMPAYVFILAWVHWRAIIQNHHRYLEQGGRFVNCFPGVQVVAQDSLDTGQ